MSHGVRACLDAGITVAGGAIVPPHLVHEGLRPLFLPRDRHDHAGFVGLTKLIAPPLLSCFLMRHTALPL